MKDIKYVYPLYEVRGVGAHNIEQDLYGAVKSVPKYTAMGIGVLGAIGFSKIKRILKFRKAKKQIAKGGAEILSDIEKWHELNDGKLAKICETSVNNYKTQVSLLKKQYKENEKYANSIQANSYVEPSPHDKKLQLDKITTALVQQLKLKFEEYNKGLNAWSVGKLKSYTETIFANLKDENLSRKYAALKQANAVDRIERQGLREGAISNAISNNFLTALSKKQVKTLEGLWLKEIMEVNAKAGDITNKCVEDIKTNYFKGSNKNYTIAALANVLEMDGPKGFMTTESLDEIKSYIDDITGEFKYVDKKMMDSINPPHTNESEAVSNFKHKLLESRDRVKKQ